MAKTTAPLLSFNASGQIGKTLVASKWKGRSYMRAHAIPTNPNTAEQGYTRGAFGFLNAVYKTMPADVVDAWEVYATGQVMTGRNAFIKQNLPLLRPAGGSPATDLSSFIMSPGARGGPALASITTTPGDDQLTIAATVQGTLPSGWSVVQVTLAALLDQDPQAYTNAIVYAATDASSPYSQVIAGLASAATYRTFAFAKYLRPDGLYAYSPSLESSGLTT